MSSDDSEAMPFHAFTGGPGTPFGGLEDPTAVSVTLSGFTYGSEAGWDWLARAADALKAALEGYLRLLRAADGDVTEPQVKAAASGLHNALHALPIGHAAYAGVGFPSPDRQPRRLRAQIDEAPSHVRSDADRLHPHVDTAVRGTRQQRMILAEQPVLPLEVELILARDPDLAVRQEFASAGQRSRTVMLLMERDETHDDVRMAFPGQRFASPELKLDVRIVDLYADSLHGVADLLGLDEERRAALQTARKEADIMKTDGPSVRDVLRSVGWESRASTN